MTSRQDTVIRQRHGGEDEDHKFKKYGSLASPCLRCNLEFSFAKDHRSWVGLPCKLGGYSPGEKQEIVNQYLAWAETL